jgi:hypothetical protein
LKTCLIIGNGPSLAQIPNDFLAKYTTWGSNRVYLKYVPDFYAFVDRLWVGNYIEDICNLESSMKFIRREHAHKVPGAHPVYQVGGYGFSLYPHQYVFGGHTITYVMLQFAYFYGFERVGLIGVDHYYEQQGQLETRQQGKDNSHFTPDYYSDDDEWIMPDVKLTEPAYTIARKMFEGNGREIINITPGSKLDVFPKENWRAW